MNYFCTAFFLFLIGSCSNYTPKTKLHCIQECNERGTEYVGVAPKAKNVQGMFGIHPEDVCQCR